MNKPNKAFSVEECKIQASILLKSIRSEDAALSKKAIKRFQRVPEFSHLSLDEMSHVNIQRKQALLVIALEKGFQTWTDLKCQLPFIRGGFLNQWFSHYGEAKSYLQANGGFLLPFKKQFFVCTADYINNLGFNANDLDWTLIGYDWFKPQDAAAWQRLYKKWIQIQVTEVERDK